MGPTTFNTDEVQEIREAVAAQIKRLKAISDTRPEHGEFIKQAENHLRYAFMDLGYGSALTKGLDPLANRVEQK